MVALLSKSNPDKNLKIGTVKTRTKRQFKTVQKFLDFFFSKFPNFDKIDINAILGPLYFYSIVIGQVPATMQAAIMNFESMLRQIRRPY